jgi:RimJ/RimL family protein N-acetyltransferase
MAVIELSGGAEAIDRIGDARFRAAGADAELHFGLMRRLAIQPDAFGDVIVLLDTDERGAPRALVTMSGPYPALIVGFGDAASPAYDQIVETFVAAGLRATAVNGAERWSDPFAAAWQRVAGAGVEHHRDTLAYELRAVEAVADPGGWSRLAVPADEELLTTLMVEFADAVGEPWPAHVARETVQRITGACDFLVWERDGRIVSTAGINRRTPWSSTIALVYTPEGLRGHGYASAVVAALSRRELAVGAEWVSLFADAANPTANHIYAAIGYRPAVTFRHHRLTWADIA